MIILEIRAGEGGADAKALATQQAAIYLAFARRHQIPCQVTTGAG